MKRVMLSVQELSYTYPGHKLPTLRKITFDLPWGAMCALLGPNGSGKSTLMQCCADLRPCPGSVRLVSETAQEVASRAGAVAAPPHPLRAVYVPQGHRVFASLSVLENLMVGGHAMQGRQVRQRIEEVLDAFPRLRLLLSKSAGLLSGGEQQETVLARAFVPDPAVLLVDEPLLGLDRSGAERVCGALALLHGRGKTLLIAEHRLAGIRLPFTHRIVLDAGQLASFETMTPLDPPLDDPAPANGRAETAAKRAPAHGHGL